MFSSHCRLCLKIEEDRGRKQCKLEGKFGSFEAVQGIEDPGFSAVIVVR